jgi:hypothetical protein
MIFLKIFFGVWLARKNYKMQKSEFGKYRRNPVTSGRRRRIPGRKFDQIRPDPARSMARSGHIQPDPSHFGQIRPAWPESGPPATCVGGWIPGLAVFR